MALCFLFAGSPVRGSLPKNLAWRSAELNKNDFTTFAYNEAGQVLSESYSGGTLSGRSVTNNFNNYPQRTSTTVPGYITNSFTYDTAGRMSTVGDGRYSATYSYLANSRLISQILFKENTATRMTTAKGYDYLNRLQSISSTPSASSSLPVSSAYLYNAPTKEPKQPWETVPTGAMNTIRSSKCQFSLFILVLF